MDFTLKVRTHWVLMVIVIMLFAANPVSMACTDCEFDGPDDAGNVMSWCVDRVVG
jgi:hypothetical protein